MELYDPVAVFDVTTAVRVEPPMPKRTSPFHVPTRLESTILEIHISEARIPLLFKLMHEDQPAAEEKQHHVVEKPSLARLANHSAEGVGQCGRQEHDRQHFDEVG